MRDKVGRVGLGLFVHDLHYTINRTFPESAWPRSAVPTNLGRLLPSQNRRVPPADLTADDYAVIAVLLRGTAAADRFPLSPRVRKLWAIRDKIEPRRVVEALPPPKAWGESSMTLRKKRR